MVNLSCSVVGPEGIHSKVAFTDWMVRLVAGAKSCLTSLDVPTAIGPHTKGPLGRQALAAMVPL